MTFRASKADAGDFELERLAWDILRRTATHRTSLPKVVDLSDCVMLKPYSVACLAAIGIRGEGGIGLRLPNDLRCAEHLTRIGLTQWYRVEGETPVVDTRDTNVVAQAVTSRSGEFSDRVIRVLSDQLSLAAGVASTLSTHLDEVVLNALTHADSPIGCIVVGQGFPSQGAIEVAVLDLGQTIRGHLVSNPDHESISTDADAIELATREGVTGTVGLNKWGEPNSGVGLFELRRYCESGGGLMTVLSGGGFLTFSSSGPRTHKFKGFFAGCLVNVRFFAR